MKAGTILFLIFLTLAIGLSACQPSPTSVATSPEDSRSDPTLALGQFLSAIADKDYDKAYHLQSQRVKKSLALEDFREINRLSWEQMQITDQTWEILSTTQEQDKAFIEAEIRTEFAILEPVEKQAIYTLTWEDGWKVDGVVAKPSSP